jgi:hypothetical protein
MGCAAAPPRTGAPPKPLPAGFAFRTVKSAAKPRGYREYTAECPKHSAREMGRRLDRWAHVCEFFDKHAACRCGGSLY